MKPDQKSAGNAAEGVRALAQPVAALLTRAAIFLVVTLKPGSESRTTVRSFCGDLSAILRAVEMRDLEAALSCIMGIGSEAWDRLFGPQRCCIRSGRFVREGATLFPRRATCCFTFARSEWICASSWRRKSWRASVMQ